MKLATGGTTRKRPSAKHNRGAASNPNMTVSRSKPSPESGAKPASSRPRAASKSKGLPVKKAVGMLKKEAFSAPMVKAAKGGRKVAAKRQLAKAKTRGVLAESGLTKRQKGVIRTGAREITQGNKPISTTRFIRSAAKDIAGGKKKGYKQALIKSALKTTTKAEAKGVRKVLSRADRTKAAPRRKQQV